ncbi:pre-B-cell leukemia transcription factor-interacting protein 1-like isoform X1 [Polypterus senegalus]|uniref:pre-B-cell leukemia transcription factor-interacting protein 1-like isoform X1 n=1 Tax=Polypterus senegalus TaxID=55291 RepID=UPI001966965B|nr:pre-B-cell leukemia transcription factor-interacting protein 1-like isoform X1 [Polypterus senegalus]
MSENSNSNGSNSSWTMVSPEDSAAETESSGDNGIESLSAETVAEFPTSSELESLLPHTEQLSSFEDQPVKKVLLEKGGAESETFEKKLTQEESNVVNIPQSIGCLEEDEEEGEIGQKSGAAHKMANIGKQAVRLVIPLVQTVSLDGICRWGKRLIGHKAAGEDLDELSSSSEESGNTVRKRRGTEVKSPTGADFIERGQHEVRVDQEQWWDGLTLNKCIIGALVLLGLGVVLFSGSYTEIEDDEGLETEELKQEALSQTLDWQNINMEQLQEDPQALQTLTKLLDKLAKENQQIRLMQAQLQTEKEELQTVLEKTEATMQCPELVQKNTQLMQKVQLLPALQEEVEILRQKVTEFNVTGSTSSLLNITLESENRRLAEELKIEKEKTSALLNQKETLVAETLMLRQELDKQRKLLESMRTELEGLVGNSNATYTEGERTVRGTRIRESLVELEKRLALELQHSEKLKDKKYSPHTQLHHDQKKEMKNKIEMAGAGKVHEWKEMGDKNDFRKKEGHVEGLLNEKENKWKTKKEDEWKMRKEGEWKTRKERNIKREDEETWKDRKEYNLHKTEHKHVHSQWNKENKPRGEDKGDMHKVKRHWETPGEGAARPDHRHHEHNKFWKNDGERKKHYRAPEGCTGIEECALKEGMEHFKTSLKPVQQQDFGKILGTYLEKVKDQISRQELEKFSDGFFENGVFVHDRMFFRDFVEDVEEMLEDIIERQGGKDDEIEEFDEEVLHHFLGVERGKNRHNMKVKMKKPWQQQHHNKPHKKQKDGMKKHFYKDKREKYQEDWPHKRKRWEWHGASVSHHPRH